MRLSQILCPVLLCVLVSCEEEKTHSVTYSVSTFNDGIAKSNNFVMFYAPWCGHCKNLKPTWEQLAEKLNANKKDDTPVIGKVDCTVDTDLCNNQDITGYPTLKFFQAGSHDGVKYRGQRDIASLEAFIKQQLSKEEEPKEVKESVKTPEAVNELVDLTTSTFHSHVKSGDHFVKFYAPWCGHCQRLAPTWEKLAESVAHDKSVSIAKVDCTQHREICNEFEIKGYPSLLWIRDGKKVDKYQGSRAHEDLKAYVEKMQGGSAAADTQEEQQPVQGEAKQEAVQVHAVALTKDNFKNGIATGVTFVKFFAPWCGHCKRLAPTWDELAAKFVDSTQVTIAKVDCTTEQDLCSQQNIEGYPTLFLYKQGEKLGEYEGNRKLDDLHSYVTRHLHRDEL